MSTHGGWAGSTFISWDRDPNDERAKRTKKKNLGCFARGCMRDNGVDKEAKQRTKAGAGKKKTDWDPWFQERGSN